MPKSLSSLLAGLSGTEAMLNFLVEKMKSMPKANRLLEIMEEAVAKLPEEQRAEHQQKLDELKKNFLTNEEFQMVIDDISRKLDPATMNDAELEEAGNYIRKELR